jgi:uncharacterized protein YmfQ (DUF2313 family)
MALNASDYLQQLQAVLLRGKAWTRDAGSVMSQLLAGIAEEFARVDLRADELLYEADPRTTNELLADWERNFGLPDPCGEQLGNTISLRRDVLVYKVTSLGGQSKQFYIDLAARLGFTVTITEFKKYTVTSAVNEAMNGEDWVFAWQVNAPAETVRTMTVKSGVNEPFNAWGNEILECNISRLKPAHTHVLFAYG